jgi:hypothetical protein
MTYNCKTFSQNSAVLWYLLNADCGIRTQKYNKTNFEKTYQVYFMVTLCYMHHIEVQANQK